MSVSNVVCPSCKNRALVFWASENTIVCDVCFQNNHFSPESTLIKLKSGNLRILFSPIQDKFEKWVTSSAITSDDLIEFLDGCVQHNKSNRFSGCLVPPSPIVMAELLDITEGKLRSYREHLEINAEINRIGEEINKLTILKQQALDNYDKSNKITKEMRERWSYHQKNSLGLTSLTPSRGQIYTDLVKQIEEEHRKLNSLRITDQNLVSCHILYPKWQKLECLRTQLDILCSAQCLLDTKNPRSLFGDKSVMVGFNQSKEENLLADSETYKTDSIRTIKFVPWKLLETKQGLWKELIEHYSRLSTLKSEEYDADRLSFVYNFNPSEIYVGEDVFEGYVVFCFAPEGRAVLECPKTGNATYMMQLADWKSLSQLSKAELLSKHRRYVSRIIHDEKWRYELELWIKQGGIPLFEFTQQPV